MHTDTHTYTCVRACVYACVYELSFQCVICLKVGSSISMGSASSGAVGAVPWTWASSTATGHPAASPTWAAPPSKPGNPLSP